MRTFTTFLYFLFLKRKMSAFFFFQRDNEMRGGGVEKRVKVLFTMGKKR